MWCSVVLCSVVSSPLATDELVGELNTIIGRLLLQGRDGVGGCGYSIKGNSEVNTNTTDHVHVVANLNGGILHWRE